MFADITQCSKRQLSYYLNQDGGIDNPEAVKSDSGIQKPLTAIRNSNISLPTTYIDSGQSEKSLQYEIATFIEMAHSLSAEHHCSVVRGPVACVAGKRGQTLTLLEDETAMLKVDHDVSHPYKVLAVGLITCATVLYEGNERVWIHHASSGCVSGEDVQLAFDKLECSSPDKVSVIFAHPNSADSGYTQSINTILSAGVSAQHLIEVSELSRGSFGVDNLGHIGT